MWQVLVSFAAQNGAAWAVAVLDFDDEASANNAAQIIIASRPTWVKAAVFPKVFTPPEA